MDVIKTRVSNDLDFAHIVPVMNMLVIVITNYAAIVFVLQAMVNIRQIVTSDFSFRVDPYLATNQAVAAFLEIGEDSSMIFWSAMRQPIEG